MPRQPYIPEPYHADRVFELAGIGASREDIAAEIGSSVRKLEKLYRRELKKGAAQGREQVLQKLHEIARRGQNASLVTFYVKAQCGWRDTGNPVNNAGVIRRHVFRFNCMPGAKPEAMPQPKPEV
jgi:hypothetical protein